MERTSREAWGIKDTVLQEGHLIYIQEVDLLGRKIIPGRVGHWAGQGGSSEKGAGLWKENPGHLPWLV